MARYVLKRFIQMVLLFFVFFTLSWFLLQAVPGDAIAQRLQLNPDMPPSALAEARARLGLDLPLHQQFWNYAKQFFTGDLGQAWTRSETVEELIKQRLPRTLMLFSTALGFQYIIGFQAGKYLAWRRNQRGEMLITIGGVGLFTVFYPWFGLMMILLFAVKLGWVPTNGFIVESVWRGAEVSANQVMVQMFFRLCCSVCSLGWERGRRPNSTSHLSDE